MLRTLAAASAALLAAACASAPRVTPPPAPPAAAPLPPKPTPPGLTRAPGDVSVANPNARDFAIYMDGARERALAQGVSAATWDRAMSGVSLNLRAIELGAAAPERLGQVWTYIGRRNTPDKVARGRAQLDRHAALFDRIERDYGVPREAIASIWGNETNYGSYLGDFYIVEALASLAYEGRRRSFFEAELIASLKLIEEKGVDPRILRGSYAGAVGQVQFMPSNYLEIGVDGDGDGVRDLRNSLPDAFASAANYLRHHGWRPGEPWMTQARLPRGFDFALCDVEFERTVADWEALGVRTESGASLTSTGIGADRPGSCILPAGHRGAAVIVFENYRRFLDYNPSQLYALAVGDLADALAGRPRLVGPWPTDEIRCASPSSRRSKRSSSGWATTSRPTAGRARRPARPSAPIRFRGAFPPMRGRRSDCCGVYEPKTYLKARCRRINQVRGAAAGFDGRRTMKSFVAFLAAACLSSTAAAAAVCAVPAPEPPARAAPDGRPLDAKGSRLGGQSFARPRARGRHKACDLRQGHGTRRLQGEDREDGRQRERADATYLGLSRQADHACECRRRAARPIGPCAHPRPHRQDDRRAA